MKATHSEELTYFWLLANEYRTAKRNGDAVDEKQFINELCDLYLLADNPEITQICGTLLVSEGYGPTLTNALNRRSMQTMLADLNDNEPKPVRQTEDNPCGF